MNQNFYNQGQFFIIQHKNNIKKKISLSLNFLSILVCILGFQPIEWTPHYSQTIFPEYKFEGVLDLSNEFDDVVERLSSRKVLLLHNILNKVLSLMHAAAPESLLQLFNVCLKINTFPKARKVGRLVLMRKADKPLSEPRSYQPLRWRCVCVSTISLRRKLRFKERKWKPGKLPNNWEYMLIGWYRFFTTYYKWSQKSQEITANLEGRGQGKYGEDY